MAFGFCGQIGHWRSRHGACAQLRVEVYKKRSHRSTCHDLEVEDPFLILVRGDGSRVASKTTPSLNWSNFHFVWRSGSLGWLSALMSIQKLTVSHFHNYDPSSFHDILVTDNKDATIRTYIKIETLWTWFNCHRRAALIVDATHPPSRTSRQK